jgi:H+/Cl- antiporter ClcA
MSVEISASKPTATPPAPSRSGSDLLMTVVIGLVAGLAGWLLIKLIARSKLLFSRVACWWRASSAPATAAGLAADSGPPSP